MNDKRIRDNNFCICFWTHFTSESVNNTELFVCSYFCFSVTSFSDVMYNLHCLTAPAPESHLSLLTSRFPSSPSASVPWPRSDSWLPHPEVLLFISHPCLLDSCLSPGAPFVPLSGPNLFLEPCPKPAQRLAAHDWSKEGKISKVNFHRLNKPTLSCPCVFWSWWLTQMNKNKQVIQCWASYSNKLLIICFKVMKECYSSKYLYANIKANWRNFQTNVSCCNPFSTLVRSQVCFSRLARTKRYIKNGSGHEAIQQWYNNQSKALHQGH